MTNQRPFPSKARACLTLAAVLLAIGCPRNPPDADDEVSERDNTLRVATFNLEDVRPEQCVASDDARLKAAAEVIQRMAPDILLLNEISYGDGRTGQALADNYLAVGQSEAVAGIRYRAFMAPVNTGVESGFDLDHDGRIGGAGDCWGYGEFPGQYAMTLLVREGIEILSGDVRTFQKLRWSKMPNALQPVDPKTSKPWYTNEEWDALPLSSKSHWDVPVRLENGTVLHLLCSHPTPPVFDGPEDRNGYRNHDEIRFWADYLNNEKYMVDDQGIEGGLASNAHFVILGDLNSDPDEGEESLFPLPKFLLNHSRINGEFTPRGDKQADLDDDDTAEWGMRADYVLPSRGLEISAGGIFRQQPGTRISDHFPVWVDLKIP